MQGLVNVLLEHHPTTGLWGYDLQRIHESDVQNPKNRALTTPCDVWTQPNNVGS